jgi:hypothetical protein
MLLGQLKGRKYGYKDSNNLNNFIRIQEIILEYNEIFLIVGI